jgi:immune inhibitor A
MLRSQTLLTAVFASLLSIVSLLPAQEVNIYLPPGDSGPNQALLKSRLLKGARSIQMAAPSSPLAKGAVVGTWKVLVILIDFPDYPWTRTDDPNFFNDSLFFEPSYYRDMLFSLGTFADPLSSSEYTGSLRDFYLENSYGRFDVDGVVTRWYRAQNDLAYYANPDGQPNTGDEYGFGTYPNNAQRLVEEAVAAADSAVDFALFDNDGDGWVESLFVVHAGPAAEELYTTNYPVHWDYLWSHKFAITAQKRDGVWISTYALQPQDGTIGVFSHEFGHILGLPDYYDTDRTSEGIGEWGLMGSGGWCHESGDRYGTSPAHFTAYSKSRLRWLVPKIVTSPLYDVTIPPVEVEPVAYRLWRDTLQGSEYFLIENRQNIGFDRGLTRRQKDFGLENAAGLLIYHIDEKARQTRDDHRVIDVEEASPWFGGDPGSVIEHLDLRRDLSQYQFLNRGNRGDNGDPWPGYSQLNADLTDFLGERDRIVFDDNSVPSAKDYDDLPTGVRIANIRLEGLNVRADLVVPVTTAVSEPVQAIPNQFALSASHPNPMSQTTQIELHIPAEVATTAVEVSIYDVTGRRVRVLVREALSPGSHRLLWDGRDDHGALLPNGVYYYQATAGRQRVARKLLLLR